MLEYEGLNIETSDSVYVPAEDSVLAAGFISDCLKNEKRTGLRVLDMGTGTGILGLVAAKSQNVSHVVFADINPEALDIARKSYASNKGKVHAHCDFLFSDLFLGIEDDFDIVIFNAPYLRSGGIASSDLRWDGGRGGVEVSERFLKEAMKRLNANGEIFLVYSSLSDVERLKDYARVLGFSFVESRSVRIFFEEITVSRLERK